jgi:hypothetical protein
MNPTPFVLPIVPATPDCAAELLALQRLCYREEADLHNEPNIPPLTQTLDGMRDDFRTHTFFRKRRA